MDRYPPGSKMSRRAEGRYYSRPYVTTEPAAGYLESYPLENFAIAPGSAQTLPARNWQPRSDRQPLYSKTRSSHLSLMLLTELQTARGSSRHVLETRAQATIFRILN